MLINGLDIAFSMMRKSQGKWWKLNSKEKFGIAFLFLIGGGIWGAVLGVIIGYLSSLINLTSIEEGYWYIFFIPIFIRIGKLLSGTVFDASEKSIFEMYDESINKV